MTLTLDDVKTVARLASLKINEEEAAHYLTKLQEIFALANQMDTIKLESIRDIAQDADTQPCLLRNDKVTERDQHDQLQQLTTQVKAGLYYVPPVIE